MNILLIYSKFPDTFWSFSYALRFIGKKSAFPPLGLITVAALLPEQFQIRLVDLNVDALGDDDLSWADMAFISAMAVQRKSAVHVVDRCKAKGLKIVAGGPLFTAQPYDFGQVDHLVLDEAEATLPAFLADLKNGCPKQLYRAKEYPDICRSPVPLWSLIDTRRYASLNIQYSRGCPFNCEFCNITALFGHTPRTKTPQQVVAELDAIYQAGWRGNIFFVDDNFIGNKKYLMTQLLPALIEWRKEKKGFLFNTEASINLADNEDLMETMVEAGFDTVFIGIETPDEEGLAGCNKKQNKNRNLIDSVKRIQRTGLQVQGGFIVGFDSDGPSIFQRQIDFIQKSGIVTAMVGLLQAPPGTKLYERLKGEGRLQGMVSGDNVDGTTNIIPKMDLNQLLKGYHTILKHIYRPRPYYRRVKTFLREYKTPKISIPVDFQRFLAVFRTSIRIGIFGKERIQYWNLLVWTLFRCPKLLPLAITFAIHGHHFRKICKL